MKNYFETNNYIFVHGWIPCNQIQLYPYAKTHNRLANWRNATKEQWDLARWTNGMEAAHDGIIEQNKTIVCGHWHTSFGHSFYEKKCSEFGADADFTHYYSKGIIAIDACTAHTRKINCLIIED